MNDSIFIQKDFSSRDIGTELNWILMWLQGGIVWFNQPVADVAVQYSKLSIDNEKKTKWRVLGLICWVQLNSVTSLEQSVGQLNDVTTVQRFTLMTVYHAKSENYRPNLAFCYFVNLPCFISSTAH